MTPPSERSLIETARFTSVAAATCILVGGTALLAGSAAVKNVLPGLVAMKTSAALAFVLAGLSLWLLRTEERGRPAPRSSAAVLGHALAFGVTILGLLTLGEYLFHRDLGIDQHLFSARTEHRGTSVLDHVAPETAFNFALVGVALLLLDRRRGNQIGQIACLLALLASLLGLVSYIFHVEALRRVGHSTALGLPSAMTFLLLSAGILTARPHRGLMPAILHDSAVGVLARRLLASAVIVPILLGWLHIEAERAGLFGTRYGLALLVTSSLVIFASLIWYTATVVHRAESSRRRAVQDLRESESRFRGMFEQAAIGFALVAPDGRWLQANTKMCKIVGYDREELLARRFQDITCPEDLDTDLSLIHRILSAEIPTHTLETRYIRRDHSIVWVNLTISLVRDESNEPEYLIAAIEDISERKETAEQLRRNARYLETLRAMDRAILDQSSAEDVARAALARIHGLILCDLATVVLFDLTSHTAHRLATNARRTDLVDSSAVSLDDFSPQDVFIQNPSRYLENLASEHNHPPVLDRLQRAGMRSVIVESLLVGGELFGALSVSSTRETAFTSRDRDVAREVATQLSIALQQARMRAKLQQHAATLERRVAERTAQLEVTNRELESFSYSVSHDLRAPLRVIDGLSKALMEDCAGKLEENLQDHLRWIRAASKQMAQLIEDLLRLSHVTSTQILRKPVDMTALAQDIIAQLRRTQPDRDVTTICAPSLVVNGDPTLLRALLDNLIGNAWKYTGKQSHARIELGVAECKGARVYFVRDDGAGFDMQYATKLFRAFQRLHSSTEFEGTGIGLATAQRIVHRHGGRIWAESAPGQGATFYFTLPSSL